MGISKTIGIVIDSVNIGEADKILTIFTQKYGKIEAVAKGAKRPKSPLVAASNFLALGEYMLYKGEMYKINSCELIETFYPISQDVKKLVYASYITEIIRDVLPENERNYKLLQLYLNTLFCIAETGKNLDLIARIFEMRMMSIIGFKPNIDKCVSCKNGIEEEYYFSFKKSGIICKECKYQDRGAIRILGSTLKALKYILEANIKKVYSIDLHEQVLDELKLINTIYMRDKLEKEYKTLEMLK